MVFDNAYKNEIMGYIDNCKSKISNILDNINNYEDDLKFLKFDKYYQAYVSIVYNIYCQLDDTNKQIIYCVISS